MRKFAATAAMAALLAACGGGHVSATANGDGASASAGTGSGDTTTTTTTTGSSHSGSCTFITGGMTRVSSAVDSGCVDCTVSNEARAIDGDASTVATINESQATPTAGFALRATAQPGIVFPAGQYAGARMTLPGATGPGQTAGVTLKTYLAGTLQESHNLVTPQTCGGACNSGQTASSQTFQTIKQFDAVEVYVYGGNDASAIPATIAEFCSDR